MSKGPATPCSSISLILILRQDPGFHNLHACSARRQDLFAGVLPYNAPAAAAALLGGEVCGTSWYRLFPALWSQSDGLCMHSSAAFASYCAVAARLRGGQILNFQQLPWPLRVVPLSWGAGEGLRGSLWPQLPVRRPNSWEDTKVLFKQQIPQVVNTPVLTQHSQWPKQRGDTDGTP